MDSHGDDNGVDNSKRSDKINYNESDNAATLRTQEVGDPVSNWVESTLTGAVRTTEDSKSGTILMGVPPPVPKSKSKVLGKKLPPSVQRKWLMINNVGETDLVTLNKNELTQRWGIQLRDLRYVALIFFHYILELL